MRKFITATARNSRDFGANGNISCLSGITTREEAIEFFEKSDFNFGVLEDADGKTVGTWGRGIGLWEVMDKAEPAEALPVEPTIVLDRKVKVSRFGAAMLTEEPPAAPEPVDYGAMTDDELKAYITAQLNVSNAWLRKGVIAIFERQTLDEKQTGETKHHNGVGFNGTDASFLTSIAQQMIAGRRSLSQRQLDATRKAMFKYAGQLARIVREKHPRRK